MVQAQLKIIDTAGTEQFTSMVELYASSTFFGTISCAFARACYTHTAHTVHHTHTHHFTTATLLRPPPPVPSLGSSHLLQIAVAGPTSVPCPDAAAAARVAWW